MKKQAAKKTYGTIGLLLGIAGILLIMFSQPIGIITSIIGIIFCLKQTRTSPTKSSAIGIILNILGLIVNSVLAIMISINKVYYR